MTWSCKHCAHKISGSKAEHCVAVDAVSQGDRPAVTEGHRCCQTFSGTESGDSHRVGAFDDPNDPRRCRTPDEMAAGGMWQTDNGIWHGRWNTAGKQRRRTVDAATAIKATVTDG